MAEKFRRPKPGETEEDVLALQEEFLKSGSIPSATLVKANDEKLRYDHTNLKEVRKKAQIKKSYFKMQQEAKQSTKPKQAYLEDMTAKYGSNTGDQCGSCIVATDVQEKDVVFMPGYLPTFKKAAKNGFPCAPVLEKESLLASNEGTSKSKKSKFALMLEKAGTEKFGITENSLLSTDSKIAIDSTITTTSTLTTNSTVTTDSMDLSMNSPQSTSQPLQANHHSHSSSLLTGEGLVCNGLSRIQAARELENIHGENLHLLANLTDTEILEEQERIKELLGSKILLFERKSRTGEQQKENK